MQIGKRIRIVREYECLTQKKFASAIGVAQPTVAQLESGKRNPKDIHIKHICLKFSIREEWLRLGLGEMKKNPIAEAIPSIGDLDETDEALLRGYADLTPEQRKVIKDWLGTAFLTPKEAYVPYSRRESAQTPRELRKLRLFEYPASAGTGVYCGNDEFTWVEVGSEIPECHFGVKIQGDSMAPEIPDGSTVWVRDQRNVEDGEICIVVVNENGYCKIKKGNSFKSINPRYPDISPTNCDTVHLCGKVVFVEKP